MSNANPSRIGQIKGAGDVRALFLKIFSGEVLTVYDANTVMKGKVRTRNITSGKSAQFPAIGRTKAEYHTPGTFIDGNIIQQDEKVITIDDLLIAHTFIANIDEAISHFEVRSEYATRMGQALAQTYDRNLLSLAVKAARDPSGLGQGAVGQEDAGSVNIGATPSVDDIIDAFYTEAQAMDERNIPEQGRYALVSPATYWAMVTNDKLLNRDFGAGGNYVEGNLPVVAGFTLYKTNNLAVNHSATASTDVYPDYENKYAVDASDTAALLMHGDALGTVKLMDLASEMDYQISRQGTLMVSKMAVGHGVLRPEGIREIRKAE